MSLKNGCLSASRAVSRFAGSQRSREKSKSTHRLAACGEREASEEEEERRNVESEESECGACIGRDERKREASGSSLMLGHVFAVGVPRSLEEYIKKGRTP